MGRLPDTFNDRKIVQRLPYAMAGTVIMEASQTGRQFTSAAFLHNIDKPFEIHRMVPRVMGVVAATPVNLTGAQGDPFISCRIFDFDRNQDLVKASTQISSLIKSDSFHTWEFGEPYYLSKGQGFTVLLDSSVFVDVTNVWSVRVAFQGYLVTLGSK